MSLQIRNNVKGIYLLWLNWVIVAGALSLLVMISLWVRPVLMPLLAFGLQGALYLLLKANRRRKVPVCYILPHIAIRIMFWSGLVMLVLNILYSRLLIHHFFDPQSINYDIPFITVLIVAPITAACCLYALRRGSDYSCCIACKIKYGTPAERGFLGKLYTQEGTTQARLLGIISAAIALIGWAYYFIEYVNVNLSDPDRFIFFIAPLGLFIASIIYMALRYAGLWNYYNNYIDASSMRNGPYTLIRYLVFWDNYIMLVPPENNPDRMADPGASKYDTPDQLYVSARKNVTVADAANFFRSKNGFAPENIRFMYSTVSGNADYNIFHFLCFLTDREKETLLKARPGIIPAPLGKLHELINSKQCNTLLSAEIIRLHTIAMAWKTYDRNGRRLYRIKHYTPTFRLRDICNWNVDYNDSTWLRIARFNQDSPFYSIRRHWKSYTDD
jgi:hypothetical protein